MSSHWRNGAKSGEAYGAADWLKELRVGGGLTMRGFYAVFGPPVVPAERALPQRGGPCSGQSSAAAGGQQSVAGELFAGVR